MDKVGNIAVGYSVSGTSLFPSMRFATRAPGDAAGTLGAESSIVAGTGSQTGSLSRWGDYSTITVDPVDDCTFWYTNEYYGNPAGPTANWQTRVGNFKFSQCTPRPTGLLAGIVTDNATGGPIAGAKVTAGGYTALTH